MNPAAINDMSWAMAEVYGAVTDQILINLAHHFKYYKTTGEITSSFQYQAKMLAQMGQVRQETIFIIQEYLGDADDALAGALQDAILFALRDEEPKLRKAAEKGLLSGGVPQLSPNQLQAFRAYYKQSADKLNLVNTVMLESTQNAYMATVSDVVNKVQRTQGILNSATGEVVTGVSTWNQALHGAVQKMVSNGLTGFIDHGGHKWSPEAYVAMDIRTTMFNTSRAAIWERSQQYGNDLYQVSSHQGARPLCYPWQGKVISTSGRVGVAHDLDGGEIPIHSESEIESFKWGGGLFGVNCGHYPMVFIDGVSMLKGEPQDPEDNAKVYAESQQQRALERKLREEKRDLEVMKAQGASPQEIAAQRERVRNASADIDQFCDDTGRARKRNRESAPVRATWHTPDGDITRYNGGYIGTDVVPPPKGQIRQIPPPKPQQQNVAQQATNAAQSAVQSDIPTGKSMLVQGILPNAGISEVPIKKWSHTPTEQEIINSIAGADQTSGSCASVALAYAGNRAGYDVHDFRGGASMEWFSKKSNTTMIAELPEVAGTIINGKKEIEIANQLLESMEEGKEYWLGIGRHASIVKKTERGYEYLELQSSLYNGWQPLNDDMLKYRFGCVKRRAYDLPARLMSVDKLTKSDDFIALLKYINTEVDAQMKGVGGGIK